MDKIPSSAAVNEAVNLTKKYCRNPRAAGMVNGILRSILRTEKLSEPAGKDQLETLSIKYSHPRWLVEEFAATLGTDGTEKLLSADNEQPPITVQINTNKKTIEQVEDILRAEGVEIARHPLLHDCLTLSGTGNLEHLTAFQDGLFYVQDVAARLAVTAAGILPGQRILDCCAAPGGKSFAAAIDLQNRGEVISCDIHAHKIKLLEAGRDRLGLDVIKPLLHSATEINEGWISGFDVVITDVPCSGLGIIRKKPDIRYKDPEPLKNLPTVQKSILNNCSAYVKSGGILIYATCTLLKRENEDIVFEFLSEHPEFVPESLELNVISGEKEMLTFWPHIHNTDGFFVAKLRKKE
jgi:16S rRNA (cytosine967-C5)-methyltransferase